MNTKFLARFLLAFGFSTVVLSVLDKNRSLEIVGWMIVVLGKDVQLYNAKNK